MVVSTVDRLCIERGGSIVDYEKLAFEKYEDSKLEKLKKGMNDYV